MAPRNFAIRSAILSAALFAYAAAQPAPAGSALAEANAPAAERAPADWLNVRECGATGSTFETTARTAAGSREITVADVGDFRVGEGVMVSRSNVRLLPTRMWGTGIPYFNHKDVQDSVDVRGYDGRAGSWVVYILDIEPSPTPAFRWTDDLGRTWHAKVGITHEWQALGGGVEVRLNQRDWQAGYVIAFGGKDQLASRIEKIEGHVLTLADSANRTSDDARVDHNDTFALQDAVDRAIRENRKVYVPVGNYRLSQPIMVRDARALTIEGASAVDTVLDISAGEGACIQLLGGTEVSIRNFRFVGFMGFGERDQAGYLDTRGSTYIWGFQLKPCNAITIKNTERALIENCHASRMSGECFVSAGQSRAAAGDGHSYSHGITYLRCSVTDCARNAFNDVMCGTENTSVLNCRIVDVGGCAWEGAGRFVKFVGNYIRNAGSVALGNLGPANHDNTFPDLGAGQHLIADNVFESFTPYGGRAIRSRSGATQVIIRNNLFINFDSSAIEASGDTDPIHYASSDTIITGNSFDMTCVGQKPLTRAVIRISANDTLVSDNQIFVRGAADATVTAIQLYEPALNVNVHDNLIRNCGVGIVTKRAEASVGEVVDDRTFLRSSSPAGLPLDRINPAATRGWQLLWRHTDAAAPGAPISIVDAFDPATLRFRLQQPHPMKAGDRFEVVAPSVNWTVHDNTIVDCLQPVLLDSYGSATSEFKNNSVTRGDGVAARRAIEVHGRFQVVGNHVSGFRDPGAAALALFPDADGRVPTSRFQGNVIEACFDSLTESRPGLWQGAVVHDNLSIDCVHPFPR